VCDVAVVAQRGPWLGGGGGGRHAQGARAQVVDCRLRVGQGAVVGPV